MRRLLIVLGILVAANVLVAQDTKTNERIQDRQEEIKTRLNLSDEQSEQLKALREKYRPELKSIRDDDTKSRSEKLRAVADLMDQKDADLQGILNQNQIAELSVIRKEMRQHRLGRRERMRDRMKQRRSRKR